MHRFLIVTLRYWIRCTLLGLAFRTSQLSLATTYFPFRGKGGQSTLCYHGDIVGAGGNLVIKRVRPSMRNHLNYSIRRV